LAKMLQKAGVQLDQLAVTTGGRKKDSVPFTWIMKLAHVVPVHIDKQASQHPLGGAATCQTCL